MFSSDIINKLSADCSKIKLKLEIFKIGTPVLEGYLNLYSIVSLLHPN